MLTTLHAAHPGITQVWADAGSTRPLIAWAKQEVHLTLTITKRPRRWMRVAADTEPPPMPARMLILPRRWVIERTFAWVGRSRRLSKDYEGRADTEAGWILLAMVRLIVATRKTTLLKHPLAFWMAMRVIANRQHPESPQTRTTEACYYLSSLGSDAATTAQSPHAVTGRLRTKCSCCQPEGSQRTRVGSGLVMQTRTSSNCATLVRHKPDWTSVASESNASAPT